MLQLHFRPYPELKTERLLLRQPELQDAHDILFLRSDERVMQYIDRERAASIADAEKHIQIIIDGINAGNLIWWGITLKHEPWKIVGTIGFFNIQKEHYRAEIGYTLHPDLWRKGYMKETINKVLDYGFNVMQLHSVEANINPENKASAAILQSTGFVQEAFFKENFYFQGKFLDSAIYSKLHKG